MENEGNGTMKIFGGVTVTVKRLEVGWCAGGGGGVIKESLQKYLEIDREGNTNIKCESSANLGREGNTNRN